MKITFCLGWVASGKSFRQAFKSKSCYDLFADYLERVSKFAGCEVTARNSLQAGPVSSRKLWICERSRPAKQLSSEDVASRLKEYMNSGVKRVEVVIGPADGFKSNELTALKPDILWSFGNLTLPHELAAVVAGEQIYRAWTILRGLPYHCGH